MKKVISTVAGTVITCSVSEGAEIQIGDEIVKIESMKMEIPIESEEAGRLLKLLVEVGDDVDEGQEVAVLD